MRSVEQDVPKGETFLVVGGRSIFALRYYCGHSEKGILWGRLEVVERLVSGPGKT